MAERPQQTLDAEALNDRLAREYSIDDYYERSAWFIRLVEGRRLSIIRDFVGPHEGLDIAEVGSGGGHVLRMFPRARLTAMAAEVMPPMTPEQFAEHQQKARDRFGAVVRSANIKLQ